LRRGGVRVHLDDRADRPGAKYYYWESRGLPLRLEVGPREAEAKTASAVSRLGDRRTISRAELVPGVRSALAAYDDALGAKARSAFAEAFSLANTLEELKGSTTVRLISWCGTPECGHRIEEAIDGALLGTLEGAPPIPLPPPGPCVACARMEATVWSAAGRPL
ncbi:MAG: His/Gly/Thr/Pro-type tRNA ligase C-terminal domain-containing protein, partial [Thermoplasmata archaeon]|nr:His/Gly/Thr/Pro-type tRNA ligase C-terminal domain-containing protein [Thermoplasmata archaeon]